MTDIIFDLESTKKNERSYSHAIGSPLSGGSSGCGSGGSALSAAGVLAKLPRIDDSPYLFPASKLRRKGQPATVFGGWAKRKLDFNSRSLDRHS